MSKSVSVISDGDVSTLGIPRGNQFSIGLENKEDYENVIQNCKASVDVRDNHDGTKTNVLCVDHEDKCSLVGEFIEVDAQLTLDGDSVRVISVGDVCNTARLHNINNPVFTDFDITVESVGGGHCFSSVPVPINTFTSYYQYAQESISDTQTCAKSLSTVI